MSSQPSASVSAPDPCRVCAALPPSDVRPVPAPVPCEADEWRAVDRLRGALLGVAIGDALGRLRTERRSAPDHPAPGALRVGGATQLSLFLAEGLAHMYARYWARGIGPAWELARIGLERWGCAQGEDPRSADAVARHPGSGRWPNGWVVRNHVLHERVGGFGAVREGLRSRVDPSLAVADGSREFPRVTGSDGAGGLVRSAPAGLLFGPDNAFLVGSVTAAFTHDAPAGYLTAGAFARILAGVVHGDDLGDAVADALRLVGEGPGGVGLADALRSTTSGALEPGSVAALRLGIAAAQRSTERGPSPVVGTIAETVEVGGTAAAVVAGAILGAVHGATAIEGPWRTATNASGVIETVADGAGLVRRAMVMRRPVSDDPPPAGGEEDDAVVLLVHRAFPT
jgi:hypothetical protein